MKNTRTTFYANLFYSYSHKDAQHRDDMEKALAWLKRNNLLRDWSDLNIRPGQAISKEIRKKMDETDIFVFLLSPDFIFSEECMKEWEYAKQLAIEGKLIFRIPIILRDCSWEDLLSNDDIKALPEDGKPIANFDNQDTAWLQVYEGIRVVINQLRETFTPKSEFISEMEKTDFASLEHIKLQDIFVFPTLSYYRPSAKDGLLDKKEIIKNREELLAKKYLLIHGEEMSGKTALGRRLFLALANSPSTPVLHIDLQEVPRKINEKIFSDAYYRQFSGDYSLWKEQEGKILILDNLSSTSYSIGLVEFAKVFFDKIVITLPSDIFYSFFRDETRLVDFHEVEIEPLRHQQQEQLIRKRLVLSNRNKPVSDGFVDQVENDVNSIITSQKIVPRYPFFVLSILQMYEGFMPDDLSITAYGHCYQILIVTNLIKAGISRKDNDINVCFNFAEKLAFKIYQDTIQGQTKLDFDKFVEEYRKTFIISDSILSRLRVHDYGIITSEGAFKAPYVYYFFLGRFLSKESRKNKGIIEQMCEQSHVSSNYLTLLFIIHHTNDNAIIDDILLRTMCALDNVDPARLNRDETDIFKGIVDALPQNILSSNSVEEERKKEREIRDVNDDIVETEDDSEETIDENPVNDIYRILKNNEIMGQILRNRYGSLEKRQIQEVIETVADSGLRLVKFGLVDEDWITDIAYYLQKKYPDHNVAEIKKFLQSLSFLWTMLNVNKIVNSINVPEIREVVNEVVREKSTPAYELIGYFNHLDSTEKLTNGTKQELETLLKKHHDSFFKRVLSIRTQHYMNTHRSDAPIEQSICSLLNIRYSYKLPKNTT